MSQDIYGVVLGSHWFWKGKFNYSVLVVSLKCLVLTYMALDCLKSHEADANYSMEA